MRTRALLLAVCAGAAFPITATAQFAAPQPIAPVADGRREALLDYDIRRDDAGQRALIRAVRERVGSPALRQAAAALLAERVPDLRVSYDELTGSPKYVRSTRSTLSSPLAPPDQPALAVHRFIAANPALTGLAPNSLDSCELIRNARTAHNGFTALWWRRMVNGAPVFECEVRANVTADGRIATFSSRMPPADVAPIIAPTVLTATDALRLAAANVGVAMAAAPAKLSEDPGRFVRFVRPVGLNAVTEARFMYFPVNAEELRPAWIVTIGASGDANLYEVFVDAGDGSILRRQNMTTHVAPATYRVFADAATKKPQDSPEPRSPGPATPDGTQSVPVARDLITLDALDATASPLGWLPAGASTTVGNNVDSHSDRDNDDVPDLPRLAFAPGTRTLDFPFTPSADPLTNADAAITQLFYTSNWYHDRLYQLGFTEAFANFQADNLGRGGIQGDFIRAQVQDGAGLATPNANNANFSTGSSDGSFARMQMFVFDGPTPNRDGSLDAQIVLHELTHGLSIRLHGGLFGDQPDGMGEGWSDFYSLALLSDPTDDPNAVYGIGQWTTLQIGSSAFNNNYYYAIRRFPYSTDMTKNPLTYADIDPTTFGFNPATPRNGFIGSSFAAEVHNSGEVWCMALWECRANLIAAHGFAGNELMLQLVTDGMKLSAPNPNMLEARDAILLADTMNNGGANLPDLWAGFAKRGLGVGARSPFADIAADITESFATPTGVDFVYPTGRPDRVEPNAPLVITVNMTPQTLGSSVVTSSARLFVDVAGAGFTPIALGDIGGGQFIGAVPKLLCGDDIRWYISVDTADGTFTDPPGAPGAFFTAPVTTFESVRLSDNFETDQGWMVNPFGTDTATTGIWVRAAPVGTAFQPGFDNPSGTGTLCFVTGNALIGDPVGVNDIDNGATSLMSPRFDCAGGPCVISYFRWLGVSSVDSMIVELSNDDGATWTLIEDQQYLPAWGRHIVKAGDFVTPTSLMRLRFTASDLGNPSITEGAVDDVVVSVLRCLAADIGRDGVVGPSDLLALLAAWGQACSPGAVPCIADVDGNGVTGPSDLLAMLASWGQQ